MMGCLELLWGHPPNIYVQCISTEEIVLGGDFGVTFKPATSVSLWWSEMWGRLVWYASALRKPREQLKELTVEGNQTAVPEVPKYAQSLKLRGEEERKYSIFCVCAYKIHFTSPRLQSASSSTRYLENLWMWKHYQQMESCYAQLTQRFLSIWLIHPRGPHCQQGHWTDALLSLPCTDSFSHTST